MKITTGRKLRITVSKAFVEELITPVFPEYPEYREEETRPRLRVSCIVYRVSCTHLHQHFHIVRRFLKNYTERTMESGWD